MAQFHPKHWLHLLGATRAYTQLIALIFIPVAFMAAIGAYLVLHETGRAAQTEQRNVAQAILARYEPAAQKLTELLNKPGGMAQSHQILQAILSEHTLQRAALIDRDMRPRVSVGYNANLTWPEFAVTREFIGPLKSDIGTVYGKRVGFSSDSPIWLVIDLDNAPVTIARYHVWLVLGMTGMFTLMLLLICLNFYSRRWIAPMYEMRLQLQRMDADHLNVPFNFNATGELGLLQQDIDHMVQRLHLSIEDLKSYSAQVEDDLQRVVDKLEMQNISYRQARDAALSASQAKSMFLANISHELRTPLNSIDGFVNLLLRREDLTGEQQMYVQTIRKSASHLLALINDVLDFSKIEAGKLVLEHVPFNIEDAVFDVMDMLSPLACEKGLHMVVYYYADVPCQAIGDGLRFKQILTNLVSNAIKFTLEGEIIVRVELNDDEHPTQSAPAQHAFKISVQDSGIGVTPETRIQLFQTFGQADASVTRQYGGTGLGLVISRRLVRMMQGDISFEDNAERDGQGKGSTFWFDVKLGILPDDAQQWPDFSDWRVITFLNHGAARNVLRGYLQNMRATVEEASSLANLLGRLSDISAKHLAKTWVIISQDQDPTALLREIRMRYKGLLALYGYQMQLPYAVLHRQQARALYEPLSRKGLIRLLQDTPQLINSVRDFSDAQLHVLAVDDHTPNLLVLEALLQELGVQVSLATSGPECLSIIEQRHAQGLAPFHLIFMDIQMPRMSGLEASQRIRLLENSWSSPVHMPIIALTAHALADEREHLLAQGLDDYMSKPIQLEQLEHVLEHWALNTPAISFDRLQTSNNQSVTNENSPHSQARLQLEATPDLPLVDWSESLRLVAGKYSLANDLIHMLLTQLPDDKETLQTAFDTQDWPTFQQRIHRLQGATRYVGLPLLRATSMALEHYMLHQQICARPHLKAEHIIQLKRLWRSVLTVIEALLAPGFDINDWIDTDLST